MSDVLGVYLAGVIGTALLLAAAPWARGPLRPRYDDIIATALVWPAAMALRPYFIAAILRRMVLAA